jgi:multiple sugar transport system ATP-binding protein
MASVSFDAVGKVYPDGTRAVRDLNLEIADGEFVVFVGPSGCGKTTALRMVAGLEQISEGEIRIDGRVVNDIEPRKRDVAMIFQNYALYPHMTVFENIAFPLRSQGLPRPEIRERVEQAASMLDLTANLKRRPRNLSGGQRQRVAMGRAIVRQPKLFLMDEPLSNLDAKLRGQMRTEIARLQRELGVTTIYVTHDQVEAMTMGSRIVVLSDGVIQQQGSPQEIYDRPADLFVATFMGAPPMNLFRGAVDREGDGLSLRVNDQRVMLPGNGSGAPPTALAAYAGHEVAVGLRPEYVINGTADGASRLRASVTYVEALGSERLVHLDLDAEPVVTDKALVQTLEREASRGNTPIVARIAAHSAFSVESMVDVAIDASHLHFFDLSTGRAIT